MPLLTMDGIVGRWGQCLDPFSGQQQVRKGLEGWGGTC